MECHIFLLFSACTNLCIKHIRKILWDEANSFLHIAFCFPPWPTSFLSKAQWLKKKICFSPIIFPHKLIPKCIPLSGVEHEMGMQEVPRPRDKKKDKEPGTPPHPKKISYYLTFSNFTRAYEMGAYQTWNCGQK